MRIRKNNKNNKIGQNLKELKYGSICELKKNNNRKYFKLMGFY